MTDDPTPTLNASATVDTSNATDKAIYRLHVAVGVLSVAMLAFELVLIQLLSVVQWYHFAYMVISVGLQFCIVLLFMCVSLYKGLREEIS